MDYSITFVIDVTGSMSDNIASVIQGATTFVEQIRQSERIPEKYILVTFSDPGLLFECSLNITFSFYVNMVFFIFPYLFNVKHSTS